MNQHIMNQEEFDLWAGSYDESVGRSDQQNTYPFAGYRQVLNEIYRGVLSQPAKTVLDIGFGTGVLTAKLYQQGCQVFGQDFSQKMLELARAKMPQAQLYQGDFSHGLAEPLTQRSYDAIVATYSLHHLEDRQKVLFLQSLLPLLHPGGRIYIGDVAFATRAQLEACKQAAGDGWDSEEFYFVYEELKPALPGLTFTPCSFCAGVLTLG
jgi:2-polyprenyl-3-methyl-5-hydroxy-6-metoxy-1,4-benzoquinol methylase